MKERYEKYLPFLMNDIEHFQELAKAEGGILQEEAKAVENLVGDQWIETAGERGLQRRSKLLGIVFPAGTSLESKRNKILSLWNQHSPFTYFTLKQWLEVICGKDSFHMDLDNQMFSLTIRLNLRIKDLLLEVQENVQKMIPAHILLTVYLDYNTYGKLKQVTHGNLRKNGCTHSIMKEMDLAAVVAG